MLPHGIVHTGSRQMTVIESTPPSRPQPTQPNGAFTDRNLTGMWGIGSQPFMTPRGDSGRSASDFLELD